MKCRTLARHRKCSGVIAKFARDRNYGVDGNKLVHCQEQWVFVIRDRNRRAALGARHRAEGTRVSMSLMTVSLLPRAGHLWRTVSVTAALRPERDGAGKRRESAPGVAVPLTHRSPSTAGQVHALRVIVRCPGRAQLQPLPGRWPRCGQYR